VALSTAIAGAATVLAAVSGVGKVHQYLRRIPDRAVALAQLLATASGPVNAWLITREATAADTPDGNAQLFIDRHTVVIEAYYAISADASTETTFQDLIESVRTAFRRDMSLGSNPNLVAAPVSVRVVDVEKIGGVVCHHAVLTLPVVEYVTDTLGGP